MGANQEPSAAGTRETVSEPAPRSVSAVVLGSSVGCGASTIARGLALQLVDSRTRKARLICVNADSGQTVPTEPETLGGLTRWTLPAAIRNSDEVAAYGGTLGRLAGGPQAMIWDVQSTEAQRVDAVARDADAVLLVAQGSDEPALAELVARMLRERIGAVLLVANRVAEPERWTGRALVCVPESRLGTALVNRGRLPGGGFGAALAELVRLVERRS